MKEYDIHCKKYVEYGKLCLRQNYTHLKLSSDSDSFWKADYIILPTFRLYLVLIYLLFYSLPT